MAKLIYHIPFPDGTSTTKITPDHVLHTHAAVAFMKLRRVLPPLNPDDPNEEPRYHRFKAWVLLGTTDKPGILKDLLEKPFYKESTLETRSVRIEPAPYVPELSDEQRARLDKARAARDAKRGQTEVGVTAGPTDELPPEDDAFDPDDF